MLVLSRQKGKSIFIGDNIKIKILDVHKNGVTVGIEAPVDLPVHREEVYLERKKQEEKEEKNNIKK